MQAMRLSMACLGVGLAAAAFRITALPLSAWALAAVFSICCAARLQNDWRDRYHDLKKQKTFACDHPLRQVLLVIFAWSVCCGLVGQIAVHNRATAILLAAMIMAGLLYSETRRIPWIPICLSALASASPAFLPSTFAPGSGRTLLPLFAAAALLIFGREILKDLEDQQVDGGYKWTIPLAFGAKSASWLAVASVAVGCAVIATVSHLTFAGIAAVAVGIVVFCRNHSPTVTMKWLDAGAALVLGSLVALPP